MKRTELLRVVCAKGMPAGRLDLHPNEGSDLGLMTTRHSVELEGGATAELRLLNDCPKRTLVMGEAFWERLGRPSSAVLTIDGAKLGIEASS